MDARAVVVDHGLQAGSAEVAERACAAASSLGVPASVVPVTVNAAAGESIEAAARGVRYEALFAAAASDGRDVWVAHTLDDQAETLILGALRGNPSGMAEVTPGEGEVAVVRPFLSVRRASTVGACAELGLSPWHDPMNEDPSYRRVAVRKEIIPALSEVLGGDAVPPVAGAAARIAADQELLAALVDVSPSTDCAELAAAPAPVRQRRILAWLRAEGVAVNGAQLADIERLCTDWHGQGPVTVGSGRSVARDEARLVLRASS